MMTAWIQLIIAIASEIVGTTAMKLSLGFTRPLPGGIVVVSYAMSFYLLSNSLKHIPLGVAYAIWSGLGTVGIFLVGVLIWNEQFTLPRVLGILFIIVGVVLVSPRH
jgi:small multidrug resistance pump